MYRFRTGKERPGRDGTRIKKGKLKSRAIEDIRTENLEIK